MGLGCFESTYQLLATKMIGFFFEFNFLLSAIIEVFKISLLALLFFPFLYSISFFSYK